MFDDLSRVIINEAVKRGLDVEPISEKYGIFRLSNSQSEVICRESLSSQSTAISAEFCGNKDLSKKIVSKIDVEIPKSPQSLDEIDIRRFLADFGSVVIKPTLGEQGHLVFVDVKEYGDVERIRSQFFASDRDPLIEQYIEGYDVRVLVIGGRAVAAANRTPPFITGDGHSTILELIREKNFLREKVGPKASEILVDFETSRILRLQNQDTKSIPLLGEKVLLRKACNVHTGGEITDITEIIDPSILKKCEDISAALHTPVVGIDLILQDLKGCTFHFIEANERPALLNHDPIDVVGHFLDYLFP